MKATTFLAVALSAAVASAQLDQIPPCALACATTSLGETGCGLTDIACICRAEAFIQGLLPCVQASCSEAGQLDETIAAAAGLCLQAGVTLSVPTAGPTATETSTTSVPSSTDTVTTTETSASTTATETETETETTSVPTTTGGNTTDPSATTPPVPTGTDDSGAARNAIAFGGVALAMVAALL